MMAPVEMASMRETKLRSMLNCAPSNPLQSVLAKLGATLDCATAPKWDPTTNCHDTLISLMELPAGWGPNRRRRGPHQIGHLINWIRRLSAYAGWGPTSVLIHSDVQVLCPMNRGGVGARSLNIELQAALNPAGDRKVERFGWTFAPGDKVMQIENDYDKEVYNGDIGFVTDVQPEEGELTASFDGRSVTYGFGELDILVPAYAATIHKSQGSEYPAVVIPIMTQHYTMLQRNLLYTGVTRGKRLVVLVGQKKAIAIAVRNVSGRRRWSKLQGWLSVDV